MKRMDSFRLPRRLVDVATRHGGSRRVWLDDLPAVVRALSQDWAIEVGAPYEPGGETAWVAPVRTAAGSELVLKVLWRHAEAIHEADALRVWDGDGAVRLHAVADYPDTTAMLIERCVPGTTLASLPEPEQDVVIAALLTRLWRAPTAEDRFRPLQVMCDEWADEFEALVARHPTPLEPALAHEGIALFRALSSSASRETLLCTDLHAGNVLAAAREPWLVIDPKPYVGDPTYDVLQHLLGCRERLHADPVDSRCGWPNWLASIANASCCGYSHAACRKAPSGPILPRWHGRSRRGNTRRDLFARGMSKSSRPLRPLGERPPPRWARPRRSTR